MHRTAHFITLTAGNIKPLPHTVAEVNAILTVSGGAVVACRNNAVVLDDDSAVISAQTGSSLQHGLSNVEIIIVLVTPLHTFTLFLYIGFTIIIDYNTVRADIQYFNVGRL